MPSQTFTHLSSPSSTSTTTTVNTTHFTLTTPPGTDIWRPSASPSTNRFDAPHLTTSLRSGSFKSLTCTISGPWRTKFDQGGILLVWPAPSGKKEESKWLKAGIEFFEGRASVSVVGTDRFSDWSLSPLLPGEGAGEGSVRIRAERLGDTLWVYAVGEGGEKRPLREIKWAWMEGREADAELLVGVCAAKPAEEEGESELEVTFRDWELEVEE